MVSSRCLLAAAPIRPGAPTTKISWSHASSFCAMLSMATLRLHVTSTLDPGGTLCVTTWYIVVDLPVPGGPWIFSSACVKAITAAF